MTAAQKALDAIPLPPWATSREDNTELEPQVTFTGPNISPDPEVGAELSQWVNLSDDSEADSPGISLSVWEGPDSQYAVSSQIVVDLDPDTHAPRTPADRARSFAAAFLAAADAWDAANAQTAL